MIIITPNRNNDKFRHPDGHSKIIGYCFDGYPVYGPFGYTIATDPNRGVSQQLSPIEQKQTKHQDVDTVIKLKPAGTFVNDYEYILNAGTLDHTMVDFV